MLPTLASIALAAAASAPPAVVPRVGRPLRAQVEIHEASDTLDSWSIEQGERHAGPWSLTRLARVRDSLGDRWRLETREFGVDGRARSTIVSECNASTLAPLTTATRSRYDSSFVEVTGGRVVGWVVPPGDTLAQINQALVHEPIAPEFENVTMAGLPLKIGYHTTLAGLDAFDPLGIERRWDVDVTALESVDIGGQPRDCWVVKRREVSGTRGSATLWVDRTTRRVLRQRVQPSNGLEWWQQVRHP